MIVNLTIIVLLAYWIGMCYHQFCIYKNNLITYNEYKDDEVFMGVAQTAKSGNKFVYATVFTQSTMIAIAIWLLLEKSV